jgi:DNA-binding NarL/FixJ family response regulator
MANPSRKSRRRDNRFKIALVDDHPVVRERLTELLNRERDLRVCGQAGSQQEAFEVVAATQPDLVVLDLTLENARGLQIIRNLRTRHPALAILVLAMCPDLLHAKRAIQAGARGYISKQEGSRHILAAIRRVLQGRICLGEEIEPQLAVSPRLQRRPATPPAIERLTKRELQVFELLGWGHRPREVARRLGLTVKTVETYCVRAKEKLNLKNAEELVCLAIRWTHGG